MVQILNKTPQARAVRTTLAILGAVFAITASVSATPPAASPQNLHALVAGVSRYKNRPDIPFAVPQARELAWLLEANGFQVDLLTDPTATELNSALERLAQEAGESFENTILFYFAGHAETQKEGDGTRTAWLIPADGPSPDSGPQQYSGRAVSTIQLDRLSESMKAGQLLMLFDASFACDQFYKAKPVLRLPGATAGRSIRQYIIADEAFRPDATHGDFTVHLIKGLTGQADALKDGSITGTELGVYLMQRLAIKDRKVQYALARNPEMARGDVAIKRLQRPKDVARLWIDPEPADAAVRILNIRPRYQPGIQLSPGRYLVSASAEGFRTSTSWIDLKGGMAISLPMTLPAVESTATNSLGMHFRWIEAGSFAMGLEISNDFFTDGKPPHTVLISQGFFVQNTEVTVAQFKQFTEDSGYQPQAEKSGCWIVGNQEMWQLNKAANWRTTAAPSNNPKKNDDLPVRCVTWQDAQAFVGWLSKKEKKTYQLPTEAQWEYACKAGTHTPFAFGNCLTRKQAWHDSTGHMTPQCPNDANAPPEGPIAVAQLTANRWGLYDMHGNISEWCQDWFGPYPGKRVRDPKGAYPGVEKVIRGGHFRSKSDECISAHRQSLPPETAADAVGFRVVLLP